LKKAHHLLRQPSEHYECYGSKLFLFFKKFTLEPILGNVPCFNSSAMSVGHGLGSHEMAQVSAGQFGFM